MSYQSPPENTFFIVPQLLYFSIATPSKHFLPVILSKSHIAAHFDGKSNTFNKQKIAIQRDFTAFAIFTATFRRKENESEILHGYNNGNNLL